MRPPLFGLIFNKKTEKIEYDLTIYPGHKITYFEIARQIIATFIEHKSYATTLINVTSKYPIVISGQNRDIPRSESSLRRWLRSPYLRGHTPHQRQIIRNTHPPLIDHTQITQLEAIIENCRYIRPSTNPLIGKVFCNKCHSILKYISRKNGKYRSFYCTGVAKDLCDQQQPILFQDVWDAIIVALQGKAQAIAHWTYDQSQNKAITLSSETLNKLKCLPGLIPQDQLVVFQEIDNNVKSLGEIYPANKVGDLAQFIASPDFWQIAEIQEQQCVFGELIDQIWCSPDIITVKLRI